ncbi:hypothetical protein [Clostridium botulinum]|uniref:hypothetical protein n=1 Tax=Clostridium botulinum TaxID=1491 RepID=UPI001C9B40BB|nr:hypothetical protein [Clostridium botulinum]MBY6838698.1 hypothetical protein [Clostridium botulinum]
MKKVLYTNEELELDMLIFNENDKTIIKSTIDRYPVTWDIVKEMILQGIGSKQIEKFCEHCYCNGGIITDDWHMVKNILSLK